MSQEYDSGVRNIRNTNKETKGMSAGVWEESRYCRNICTFRNLRNIARLVSFSRADYKMLKWGRQRWNSLPR